MSGAEDLRRTGVLARELPCVGTSNAGLPGAASTRYGDVKAMNDAKRDRDFQTRRNFLKAATYVAPVILTLKATPAHAQIGSGQGIAEGARGGGHGFGNGYMDFSLRWPGLDEWGH